MNIGRDTRVSPHAFFRQPDLVALGNHCSVDEFVVCTTALEAGNHVHISPHVSIIGGRKGLLRMGSFTNLAAGCRVICASDGFKGYGLIGCMIPQEFADETILAPVTIEDMANVGTGAILFPGVTLGQGCVVGAGCVVRRSVAPWAIVVGNPARVIGERPRERMLALSERIAHLAE